MTFAQDLERKRRANVDVKRFSGYRIQFIENPTARAMAWQQLMKSLDGLIFLLPLWQQEPFLFDDLSRNLNVRDVLAEGLAEGELLLSTDTTKGGAIIGMVRITNIIKGRNAQFEGWSHPDYRGTRMATVAFREIKDYCFNGDLGLMKLKARVSAPNRLALHAMRAWKFERVGTSQLDAFHNGVPCDSLLFECLNPAFFRPAVDSLPHVFEQPQSAQGAPIRAASSVHEPGSLHGAGEPVGGLHEPGAVHQSGTVPGAAGPEQDDTAGIEPAGHVEGGSGAGLKLALVAPDREREPFKPSRPRAVRTELQDPIRRPTDSE